MSPVKKSDRTILKFSVRKDCQHLMRIKKPLKDLNPAKYTIADYEMNGRNFGTITKFISTFLSMVQL